jgi:ribonuclease HII
VTSGLVVGVDEAGRGALVGPVVAGAVVFDRTASLSFYKDSKKLTEKKREELFDKIYSEALHVGIGIVEVEEIDRINILEAAMLAMKQAIEAIPIKPDEVLIDGNRSPELNNYKVRTIIKGDQIEPVISAASIIAKVTRDRIICDLSKQYPQYNLAKNKGYGTKEHYDVIMKFGSKEIHRKSFNLTRQQPLF